MVGDSWSALQHNVISRRDFLKTATLLGVSFGTASQLAGVGLPVAALPAPAAQPTPKRGGILNATTESEPLLDKHPGDMLAIYTQNIVRQVAESLLILGNDNIVRPLLAERWVVNRDLTEWTLHLRQGILFNDGTEFSAADVIATMTYWTQSEIGSNLANSAAIIKSLEAVDRYTVKVYLQQGSIYLTELLARNSAVMMPASFEGSFLEQPIGTGPFTLTSVLNTRINLTARTDYWQIAADGKPLPYLDGIGYETISDYGTADALIAKKVHTIYKPTLKDVITVTNYDDIKIQTAPTSQTLVLKMRVDKAPWTDVRVRNALKKCQDRQKILDSAWLGYGQISGDAHIAPSDLDYDPSAPVPEKDIAGAKALLEEWAADTGNTLPIAVTLATKNDEGEPQYAEVLQQDAREAGFDITLSITDPSGYWINWDDHALGITAWEHYPMAQLVLEVAYLTQEDGTLARWTETQWQDDELDALLTEAAQTIDLVKRQEIAGQIQRIFQERGPIGIAFFKDSWRLAATVLQGVEAHPMHQDLFTFAWLDE